MRKNFAYLLVGIMMFFITSCSKDKKGCWQAFSPLGFNVQGLVICDKKKSEAEAIHPQYWYYNTKEDRYCWSVFNTQAGTSATIRDAPNSMIVLMKSQYQNLTFTKINC